MLQRWQAVGNTASNLTGPRFEPRTSHSRDERVSARPTGQFPTFKPYVKSSSKIIQMIGVLLCYMLLLCYIIMRRTLNMLFMFQVAVECTKN